MNPSLVPVPAPALSPAASEELRLSEWTALLGHAGYPITKRAVAKAIQKLGAPVQLVPVQGGTATTVAFAYLPESWRVKLEALRAGRCCRTFGDLLTIGARWVPPIETSEMTAHNKARALAMKAAMTDYYAALDAQRTVGEAGAIACARWEQETAERNPALLAEGHRALKPTVSTRHIERARARVEAAGGIAFAPLQAYGHFKQVEHVAAQAHTKHKRTVPPGVNAADYDLDTFLKHFRARCVKEGMVQTDSAIDSIDMAWKMGGVIPGLGKPAHPGMAFPFTKAQLRQFAPGYAARKLGGQGKFRALADGVLPRVRTRSTGLQLCQRYLLDDTRLDVAAKSDVNGNPIELKVYFVMEEATRRIVAYTVRRVGGFKSSDTAALVARTLRTAGLAARGAGYVTTIKVERGVVAMPKERKQLLEAMFPGQLEVTQTGMVGGALLPGDFVAPGSGAFWHKGKIEAFNKAFGFLMRWLPGQRGPDWRHAPAALGSKGIDRVKGELSYTPGSMLAEAAMTAPAARLLAILNGQPDLPAIEAERQAGFAQTILFESDVLAAIAAAVAYHNAKTGHAMEGFEKVPVENARGGRSFVAESPLQKWGRLEADLAAQGAPLQRISPADAAALLMTARKVVVTPDGVKHEGRWYFDPHSAAIHEAQNLATLRHEMLALFDPGDPSLLYLVKNPVNGHKDGDDLRDPIFLEALPLDRGADSADPADMARAGAKNRENHNIILGEFARAAKPLLDAQDERRVQNTTRGIDALLTVMTTVAGEGKDVLASRLAAALRGARVVRPATPGEPAAPEPPADDGEPTRAGQQPQASSDLTALLALIAEAAPAADA